jgi:hypothetical protein
MKLLERLLDPSPSLLSRDLQSFVFQILGMELSRFFGVHSSPHSIESP